MDGSDEQRSRRAALFAEKRRRRTRQQAARTPLERIASADDLRTLWRPEAVASKVRPTDEPVELWRAVRARLRSLR